MRVEELGRFKEAALVGEGVAKDERALRSVEKAQDALPPRTLALLAIVHGLAEEWDVDPNRMPGQAVRQLQTLPTASRSAAPTEVVALLPR